MHPQLLFLCHPFIFVLKSEWHRGLAWKSSVSEQLSQMPHYSIHFTRLFGCLAPCIHFSPFIERGRARDGKCSFEKLCVEYLACCNQQIVWLCDTEDTDWMENSAVCSQTVWMACANYTWQFCNFLIKKFWNFQRRGFFSSSKGNELREYYNLRKDLYNVNAYSAIMPNVSVWSACIFPRKISGLKRMKKIWNSGSDMYTGYVCETETIEMKRGWEML